MIKEAVIKAADRAFELITAILMRRAIARLTCMDESVLGDVGLSRSAVADFLDTPIGTDPGRFFARRRRQEQRAQILHRRTTDTPTADPMRTQRNDDGTDAHAVCGSRHEDLRLPAAHLRNAVDRPAARDGPTSTRSEKCAALEST